MAMTAAVKDELSRLPVTKKCCRKAEVSALLRFAGGLHIVSGKIVVEAELDTGQAARRLRRDLAEIFGHESEVSVLSGAGIRKGSRYLVRVATEGEHLAKQVGLVDGGGRPIRGLPPHIVSASLCDAEAAWRGAFLAHGSLTEPGRSSSLEITCPGPEAALALARGVDDTRDVTGGPQHEGHVARQVVGQGVQVNHPTKLAQVTEERQRVHAIAQDIHRGSQGNMPKVAADLLPFQHIEFRRLGSPYFLRRRSGW